MFSNKKYNPLWAMYQFQNFSKSLFSPGRALLMWKNQVPWMLRRRTVRNHNQNTCFQNLSFVDDIIICSQNHSSWKGRHKKLFFFLLSVKGAEGVSANPKNLHQKILRFFLPFLTIFFIMGGLAKSKKSLSETTEMVKKGEGGVSVFD